MSNLACRILHENIILVMYQATYNRKTSAGAFLKLPYAMVGSQYRIVGTEWKVDPYLGIDYQGTACKNYMSGKLLKFSIKSMSRHLNT